ncbi:MAG: alpha/beta fold hydrolase [Candidatus Latescibacterota bacterium]
MSYITVGKENASNINLYFEDQGSGKPVVLIHGWPLNGAAWERQVPALLDAGYRVITYDRRGFGKSSHPSVGYDYDTFTEDLNQVMTTLDLRDTVLIGHSMGSAEVTHYLGTYGSDRVSKGILIGVLPPFLLKTSDNPAGVDGSVFEGIRAKIAKDRFEYAWEFVKNFYNADVLGGSLVSDQVLRNSWNVATLSSGKAFADCVLTWTTDFREDLPRINIPLLLIHGDSDRILPYDSTAVPYSKMVRNSRLVTIQGGPHGIPWTHVDLVNTEILNFIEQRVPEREFAETRR